MSTGTKHSKPRLKRSKRDLQSLLEEIDKQFFDVIRRPPLEGDRAFYWSYCYSESEIKTQTIETMLRANTPHHLIYIFDKTGFTVDAQSYKRLSKEEKNEIKAANLEYHTLRAERDDEIYSIEDYNDFGRGNEDPLVNALYILGNFIDRHDNSGQQIVNEQRFICGYLTVRAYRIVRAIFRSQRHATSEESLVLVRSLYEIYCKLIYAARSQANAKYLLDSDFGLVSGEYEFKAKNGKLNRHILVHKKTKKTIPRVRSFYEYVSCSPYPQDIDLFSALYEYLSSFVHSGSRHALKSWSRTDGFSLTNDKNDEEVKVFVLMLTSLISAMIMQMLLRIRTVSPISRWDIGFFSYVLKKILVDVGTPVSSEISQLLPRMKARANALPKRRRAIPVTS